MTTATVPVAPPISPPLAVRIAGFRLWTVAEYEELIRVGFLTEYESLELIEGHLVHKMAINPPHAGTVRRLDRLLQRHLPSGWDLRTQAPLVLSTSVPEPDLAIVVADPDDYRRAHPTATATAVVIEVADTSLEIDRADKTRVYARDGLPVYWIVNLVDGQIEVYTEPSGPSETPGYATRQDYRVGDAVPLVVAGVAVASLVVAEVL